MKRTAFLLLLTSCRPAADEVNTGCGGDVDDPMAAIVVADAQLEDVTLWQAGFVMGHAEGDAVLVIHDINGNELVFDARLDGEHVGLVADASTNVTFGSPYPLALPEGIPINGRELLGDYAGPHVGLGLGVGGQYRSLKNESGVTLNIASFALGVGAAPVTWERLDLALWDDPLASE